MIPLRINETCTLSRVGAAFPHDMAYKEWLEIGQRLEQVEACFQWVLGDWLNFGGRKYGEKYKAGVEFTGLDMQTLKDYAWVANAIPMSFRKDGLSFSHHKEVAHLPAEEGIEWLSKAEANKWSKVELRRQIRMSNGEYGDEPDGGPTPTLTGWALEGVRLVRRKLEAMPVDQWPASERAIIKRELQPIVDLWGKL